MSRIGVVVLTACILAAIFAVGPAAAKLTTSLTYADVVIGGESSSVTVVARRPAAFTVTLKAPVEGRTKLFLRGTHAPRGPLPLIDTKTFACQRRGMTLTCQGTYEPLPKGTYTFRMTYAGAAASLRLSVRW